MTQPGTELQLSQKTIDMFANMLTALEEYDAGGGDSILQQIMAAETVDDYNKPFSGDRAMRNNIAYRVERVRYARSEFAAGLPFYAVVDGVDTTTGEAGQWVTGATSVVAALVRASFTGQLPCTGEARESAKATKSGYTPVNWIMLSVAGPAQLPLAVEPPKKK